MITIEAYRARIECFFVKHHRGTQTQKSQRSFETDCCGWNAFFHIWIFLFILTLSININMAFLKVSLLLLGGDIESNPGPPVAGKIQKVVLGSFIKVMPILVTLLAYNAHVMRFMQYVSP